MKKKNDSPITKQDLQDLLKQLATKTDVKNLQFEVSGISKDVNSLKTDVGTLKTDVGTLKTDVGTLKTEIKEFKIDMAVQLSELETKIDDKAKKYRDQILTKMDGTMKELEEIREEQTLSLHQDKVFQRRLDNHEKRIKRLEQRAHTV